MNQAVSSVESLCRHCGLPNPDTSLEFCCPGCEIAWDVINGSGLEEYYRFRDQDKARPVSQNHTSFEYLREDDYLSRYVKEQDGALQTQWYIDGLHCPACVWLIEKVAMSNPGVQGAELGFSQGRLDLAFEKGTDLVSLAENLSALGYHAGLQPNQCQTRNRDLLRLGLSGAIAANIMLMTMPFYTGLNEGPYAILFGWIAFVLTIPLLLFCARPFFQRALASLRLGLVDLDLPIAIGLISAWLLSTVSLAIGNLEHVYFDSMGMLVFFLLTGRFIQKGGVDRALAEGRRLLARMPQLVDFKQGKSWRRIPASEIIDGSILRFRSGDILPVDGVLLSPKAVLNVHVVSGESKPVHVVQGEEILAGSVNMGALIQVRAQGAYDDSRFSRLEHLASQLRRQRPNPKGSRLALIFLLNVSFFAILGAFIWWSSGPVQAFAVALTVYIVACPCALALAQPTARAFALREASRLGVRIKDIALFQRLRHIRRIVFDKTGILTEGQPRIIQHRLFTNNPHWLEAAILQLENSADHPIVEAFRQGLKPRLALPEPTDVTVSPGSGLAGTIEGKRLVVSSIRGFARFNLPKSVAEQALREAALLEDGASITAAVLDGQLAAIFALSDPIRTETPQLIQTLKDQGLQLTLLSGDGPNPVKRTASTLGIEDAHAAMLPEQKLQHLITFDPNSTLMAGDGLNDMGALAAAGVGVTHDQATGAALKFADVILKGRDISRIGALIPIARAAESAVKRGIKLSLFYNLIAITLTLSGLIGPLMAAVLMPLSSLSMVGAVALTFKRRRSQWAS